MDLSQLLPALLMAAWLLPLASFVVIVLVGPKLGKHGVAASYVATAAIVCSFILSAIGFIGWCGTFGAVGAAAHESG
ncbi:MAG TPA: hypothetical protein VG433_11175, partial [Pirellulales bacterium]|nr:hypothetical protein [Pirellulales bacterium]